MTTEDDELYAEFNKQEKKRSSIKEKLSLKERLFGGGESYQDRKYLQNLERKDRGEIEGIASGKFISARRVQSPSEIANSVVMGVGRGIEKGLKYGASTEVAKYVKSGTKGIAEYIPEKFEKARRDYEAGKISKKAYEEAYRQHKIDSSEARGQGTEQRHYREKVAKETDKFDREEARKGISLSAEKAYRVARATQSGRIAAIEEKIARQEMREQFAQQYQQSIPQQPQRRMVPFFSYEGGRAVDPLNIYSLPKQRQPQNQQQNQFRQQAPQQQSQPAPNMDFMNFLLGGQENPHSGKPRKKVYNFFKGIYE